MTGTSIFLANSRLSPAYSNQIPCPIFRNSYYESDGFHFVSVQGNSIQILSKSQLFLDYTDIISNALCNFAWCVFCLFIEISSQISVLLAVPNLFLKCSSDDSNERSRMSLEPTDKQRNNRRMSVDQKRENPAHRD